MYPASSGRGLAVRRRRARVRAGVGYGRPAEVRAEVVRVLGASPAGAGPGTCPPALRVWVRRESGLPPEPEKSVEPVESVPVSVDRPDAAGRADAVTGQDAAGGSDAAVDGAPGAGMPWHLLGRPGQSSGTAGRREWRDGLRYEDVASMAVIRRGAVEPGTARDGRSCPAGRRDSVGRRGRFGAGPGGRAKCRPGGPVVRQTGVLLDRDGLARLRETGWWTPAVIVALTLVLALSRPVVRRTGVVVPAPMGRLDGCRSHAAAAGVGAGDDLAGGRGRRRGPCPGARWRAGR
ncbi:hypothetical protein SVIOM74S_07992 [Streptomyces violarus]